MQPRTPSPSSLRSVDVETVAAGWLAWGQREGIASATPDDDGSPGIWQIYVEAHFLEFFANAAALADRKQLHRYMERRLEHVTAASVRKECGALQSLLRWMALPHVGYLAEAPTVPRPSSRVSGTRAQKRKRVDLDAGTVERILAALPDQLASGALCSVFFLVMWETGLRRGTLMKLEAPGDYRHGAKELRIRPEIDKSRWGRMVPLTARAREALDAVVPERGRIFQRANFRKALRRAGIAAGLPEDVAKHLSPHDFRHGRVTDLLIKGASLPGTAYVVGHRQITTTNRYVHADAKAAREALELVSGPLSGPRGSGALGDPAPRNAKGPDFSGLSLLGTGRIELPTPTVSR
jgi:integrase